MVQAARLFDHARGTNRARIAGDLQRHATLVDMTTRDTLWKQLPIVNDEPGTLSPSRHAARGCLLMRVDRPCRWERASRRFRQRVTQSGHLRSAQLRSRLNGCRSSAKSPPLFEVCSSPTFVRTNACYAGSNRPQRSRPSFSASGRPNGASRPGNIGYSRSCRTRART